MAAIPARVAVVAAATIAPGGCFTVTTSSLPSASEKKSSGSMYPTEANVKVFAPTFGITLALSSTSQMLSACNFPGCMYTNGASGRVGPKYTLPQRPDYMSPDEFGTWVDFFLNFALSSHLGERKWMVLKDMIRTSFFQS